MRCKAGCVGYARNALSGFQQALECVSQAKSKHEAMNRHPGLAPECPVKMKGRAPDLPGNSVERQWLTIAPGCYFTHPRNVFGLPGRPASLTTWPAIPRGAHGSPEKRAGSFLHLESQHARRGRGVQRETVQKKGPSVERRGRNRESDAIGDRLIGIKPAAQLHNHTGGQTKGGACVAVGERMPHSIRLVRLIERDRARIDEHITAGRAANEHTTADDHHFGRMVPLFRAERLGPMARAAPVHDPEQPAVEQQPDPRLHQPSSLRQRKNLEALANGPSHYPT